MAQYKSRDSQNPYRTGVLVSNYVEDKFGMELCQQEVSTHSFQFSLAFCFEFMYWFFVTYRKTWDQASLRIKLSSMRVTVYSLMIFQRELNRTFSMKKSIKISNPTASSVKQVSPATYWSATAWTLRLSKSVIVQQQPTYLTVSTLTRRRSQSRLSGLRKTPQFLSYR